MVISSRRLCGWFFVLALFVLVSTSVAAGVTIEGKPGSYATVQAAIDAAASDDVIVLSADTFAGFTITKPLTVEGAGAGLTVIDSTGTGIPCVVAEADFELKDVTCTGPEPGVVWATSPTISGMVTGCEFTGLGGLGIFVAAGASAVVTDNEFHGNFTGPISTVLVADMGSKITFHRNSVKGNSTDISMITYFGNPAALSPVFDPDLLTEISIRNSLFSGNKGDIVLSEFNGQKVDIVNNTIVRNSSLVGFSAPLVIKVDDAGTVPLTADSFSYVVKNNIIAGNYTTSGATVLTVYTNTKDAAVIEHNILSGTSKLAPADVAFGVFDFSNFTDLMPPPSPSPFPLEPGELFVADVPVFPGSTSEMGDLHLKTGAVAIDAGTATAPGAMASATDLDGLSRVVDGDGDSIAMIDLGCYEFGSTPAEPPVETDGTGMLIVGTVDTAVLISALTSLPIITPKDEKFVDAAAMALAAVLPSIPVADAMSALADSLAALKPIEKDIPEVTPVETEISTVAMALAVSSVALVDSLLSTPRSSEAMLAQAYRKLAQGDAAAATGNYHTASLHYRTAAALAQRALQHDLE